MVSDIEPIDATIWAPYQAKPGNGAAFGKPTPSLRHIVGGLLGVTCLPIVGLIAVAVWQMAKTPKIASNQAAVLALVKSLGGSGPFALVLLALGWVGLMIPVFLAGRRVAGGWRAMVAWHFKWRQDFKVALLFTFAMWIVEIAISLTLKAGGIDPTKLGNRAIFQSAGPKWVFAMVLGAAFGAPIAEELFFRGAVLQVAMRKVGRTGGVIISSICFGLMHAQQTLAASIYTVTVTSILGAGLALLVLKTGRLGTSVLSHGLYNATVGVMTLFLR